MQTRSDHIVDGCCSMARLQDRHICRQAASAGPAGHALCWQPRALQPQLYKQREDRERSAAGYQCFNDWPSPCGPRLRVTRPALMAVHERDQGCCSSCAPGQACWVQHVMWASSQLLGAVHSPGHSLYRVSRVATSFMGASGAYAATALGCAGSAVHSQRCALSLLQ